MSQTPPDNQDFLTKIVEAVSGIVENVRDMHAVPRIAVVFVALFILALLANVALPMNLVLIFFGGVFVFYLFWETLQFLQARADRQEQRLENRDVLDQEYQLEKLRLDHELELKKLEQPQSSEPEAELAAAPDPADLQVDYLNWVITQVRELSLIGIDPKVAGEEQDGRLHLDAVYTALLTYDTEDPGRKMRLPEGLEGREDRPVSAVAQLDRHGRLVLLGDPGSGKSTFVSFVALCLANEWLGQTEAGLALLTKPLPDENGEDEADRQPWSHHALLPLCIILRDFAATGLPEPGKPASDKHLWRFVDKTLADVDLPGCLPFLQELFNQGQAILLLDGLDEVEEANRRREQIKQVVEAFSRKYPQSRLLVTSRTYAYQEQQWQLSGFADAQLTPLTPGQIRRFVDGWYRYTAQWRSLEPGLAQKRAEQLKEAIFSQPRLHELAERPLLLTLMASLHAWRMGELPRQRQKLYEETVDLLLDRWENRQKVWDEGAQEEIITQPSLAEWLKSDRDKVRELLNQLAYEAHAAQPDLSGTADIPADKLIPGLLALNQNPDAQPNQLIAHLRDRAGLLAAHGEGVYTFPHRTFQEYLAACYFVEQDPDYPFSLAELARTQPEKWREVLLLAGAKTGRNQVWFLVDELCPDPPPERELRGLGHKREGEDIDSGLWGAHLGGQMLLETIDPAAPLNERNQKRLERLKGWLVHCLTTDRLPPLERALAGQTLGLFGDPRPDVACIMPEVVEIPAGPFLMGSDENKDKLAYNFETPQHEVDLPTYRIGKYPVTNAQFNAFVQAGGYETERFWTKAGWQQRQEGGWTEPRYWGNTRFDVANQPVVGVSWYEAVAYCNWLQAETGRAFRLPSEAMWEKAARGTDGRIYPWGDKWNPNRLNASETNINRPSAVGIFPDGGSPYKVFDASGNVFEWCSTVWGKYPFRPRPYTQEIEGTERRIWRGGEFSFDRLFARAAFRYRNDPHGRGNDLGYRVAEHLSDTDF